MKNIFVGNLSFNTNEEELRQLFESYGQVDRVSILTDRETGRSRGFGFVEMSSNDDGEKAIAALNGALESSVSRALACHLRDAAGATAKSSLERELIGAVPTHSVIDHPRAA